MRFVVFVKANPESESGKMPDAKDLGEMQKFNEQLVKAGIMLAGEGLHPSSDGARIRYDGSKRSVIDGPFSDAKELVAGYWVLKARSRAEVIEWMRKAPFQEGEVEIRQIVEDEEFAYAPEVMAKEKELRAQIARQTKH